MLAVKNLSFAYGNEAVLEGISLNINQGEIVCLLGESGSGKSTLLRLIAGLERQYQGEIRLEEQSLERIPVHRRGFGLMFQDFALFPHMNVYQNVAFGLRMQRISRKEQKGIVDEMLHLVGLDGYQHRDIGALSGGQKQRVALARSLAPRPKLLMLDEPLGSLDAGLRERLVLDLRQIIKRIGLTAIYVTHDQQEAYAIADRIAVMNKGRIEQYDTPENLYRQPQTRFVAQFLGLSNIVPGDFLRQYIELKKPESDYLLHPESLSINSEGQLQARITRKLFQGDRVRLTVIAGQTELNLYVNSLIELPPEGEPIRVLINPAMVHAINS